VISVPRPLKSVSGGSSDMDVISVALAGETGGRAKRIADCGSRIIDCGRNCSFCLSSSLQSSAGGTGWQPRPAISAGNSRNLPQDQRPAPRERQQSPLIWRLECARRGAWLAACQPSTEIRALPAVGGGAGCTEPTSERWARLFFLLSASSSRRTPLAGLGLVDAADRGRPANRPSFAPPSFPGYFARRFAVTGRTIATPPPWTANLAPPANRIRQRCSRPCARLSNCRHVHTAGKQPLVSSSAVCYWPGNECQAPPPRDHPRISHRAQQTPTSRIHTYIPHSVVGIRKFQAVAGVGQISAA